MVTDSPILFHRIRYINRQTPKVHLALPRHTWSDSVSYSDGNTDFRLTKVTVMGDAGVPCPPPMAHRLTCPIPNLFPRLSGVSWPVSESHGEVGAGSPCPRSEPAPRDGAPLLCRARTRYWPGPFRPWPGAASSGCAMPPPNPSQRGQMRGAL